MLNLIDLQYWMLKKAYPKSPDLLNEQVYAGRSKLADLLGEELVNRIAGKTVIDFGCGVGTQAVEMAQRGATRVIGLDIRENELEIARQKAIDAGVQQNCVFAVTTLEPADIIVTLDAFEHFGDPAEILRIMSSLLQPGGELIFSFGPTWYHPLGGHLFSVFPWSHILFSEKALLRWRSTFKDDHATRFGEVSGGLNQITIGRFEKFIEASPFRLVRLECIPIRKLRSLHNRVTREFTTAVVRGQLVKQ